MRLSGKIIGFLLGCLFGGPLFGFFGLWLGHLHDKSKDALFPRREHYFSYGGMKDNDMLRAIQRETYMIGVVVLGAKMAKTDGTVSRAEIDAFKRVFRIPESDMAQAGRIFNNAKQNSAGYEMYAMRLAQVFRRQPMVLEEILSGLFMVAGADDQMLSGNEAVFLGRVANIFGFGLDDFMRIAARCGVRLPRMDQQPTPTKEAYLVLGITESATNEEIKKAYRAMIRQHHPDKLTAQGLPPELIDQATEKMKRLNTAYDSICTERGIK